MAEPERPNDPPPTAPAFRLPRRHTGSSHTLCDKPAAAQIPLRSTLPGIGVNSAQPQQGDLPLNPYYRGNRSPDWIKSSRSILTQECIEVARSRSHHLVRDSKDPSGPILTFNHSSWRVFISNVRSGFPEPGTRRPRDAHQ
ncbi:DUF397 domain-containing protein [Micromonospora wenchangensis]|uniref:DUF397 domain-containing protein n=1 Tax=Micromonospora wenchangensis TaxID=1185415 RepID=UPI003D75128A